MSKQTPKLVRIALYLRVSTLGQAQREHPIEVQETLCEDWAHAKA